MGLTTALAAADAGLTVIVLDVPRPGAASRAAAGMLAPSVEGLPAAVLPAALQARDFYPSFLAALCERTGLSVPLDRRGIIQVATCAAELESLGTPHSPAALALDSRELGTLEPELAHHAGGFLHPNDGSVDNVTLMDALDLAVERHGRVRRERMEVVAIHPGTGTVTSADGSTVIGGSLVIASGAWMDIAGVARRPAVEPVRGQLLKVAAAPVSHVIYGAGGYLVPRGRETLVGATSERAGFHVDISADGRNALLRIGGTLIPLLATSPVTSHWAGLRPVSPDGLPTVARAPGAERCLWSVGYSRNGILFAPWVAAQVARALRGGEWPAELAPFALRSAAASK